MRHQPRMRQRNRLCAALGAAGLLAAAPAAAFAQDPAAPPERDAPATLDAVIVTAQKRSQNLQEVPVAVSVLGGELLEPGRVLGIDGFQGKVPNLTVSEFNAADTAIQIRGIGSRFDGASMERSVGLFIDDVYIGRTAGGTTDLFDLDRVEVLRGPQGTLFGKNTVGGAINLISAAPQPEFLARTALTFGNYDTLELRGLVNGALSERVSGRVTVLSRDHEGYAVNLNTGNRLDDLSSRALRAALLFAASDDLEVRFSADGYRRRGNGANKHALNVVNPAFGNATGPDPRHNYMTGGDGRQDNDTAGFAAHVLWSRPWGDLTSVSAYRSSDSAIEVDLGGVRFSRDPAQVSAPYTVLNRIDEQARQFSQELRLSSGSGGALDYVLGVYYLRETVDRMEDTNLMLRASPVDQVNTQTATARSDTFAVFGDFTYRFSERWAFSGGLRWSLDDKQYDALITGNRFPGLPWRVDVGDRWDAFTPRATLTFDASPQQMWYATVSRGFKSGGWDGQPTSELVASTPVNPEYAWNYEIGAKTSWLDRRLTVNAAAFCMDYTDLQVFTLTLPPGSVAPVTSLVNAAAARNLGLELEATFRATQNTTLSLTYGYLDSEITEDLILSGANARGDRLAETPEHTYGLGLDQLFPLGGDFELRAFASYNYVGDSYSEHYNSPLSYKKAYGLFDLTLELGSYSRPWKLALWGKNLTDEVYATNMLATAGAAAFARIGAPRTYGVSFSWEFR